MDLEKVRDDIQAIIKMLDELPEPYRLKTFEVLLSARLNKPSDRVNAGTGSQATRLSTLSDSKELKAFMARSGVTEGEIASIVDVENREVRQFPRATARAQGQIQTALLVALLSAVGGGPLQVDAGKVRDMCRTLGYYDEANFATNFKKNGNLFIGPVRANEPPRRLSLEGERQLAQLIRDLLREYSL